jgi:hypothetical protein
MNISNDVGLITTKPSVFWKSKAMIGMDSFSSLQLMPFMVSPPTSLALMQILQLTKQFLHSVQNRTATTNFFALKTFPKDFQIQSRTDYFLLQSQ